jgi:hypothetical protein
MKNKEREKNEKARERIKQSATINLSEDWGRAHPQHRLKTSNHDRDQ